MANHRKHTRSAPIKGAAVRLGVTALNLVLVIVAIGFAFLAIGPHTGKYRTLTMLSGSMAPAMPTGSVVIEVPVKAADVHVGDVITVSLPDPDKPVVTHRVIDVQTSKTGVVTVKTKGDANAKEDKWSSTITSPQVWKATAAIPYVGRWTQVLRSPLLHRITALVLPIALIGYALFSIWGGSSKRETQAA